uniref:Gypsy retrotransposon integrase-like protein 1 n=1 Tax=Neogobius melanostomus TaxID=47308 RepID=A0A8C6S522_9GOBI
MRDGVLYRVTKDPVNKRKTYLFVVPRSLCHKVLKGVHDEAGHQGQQRTLYLTRQRFHWLGLSRDVMDYVKHCRRCVVSKTPEPEARAPLENIRTSEPLELVSIDFWTAEDSANRSLDVLVATDHFTKMAHAFLCPNQSAKAVAHQLWNNYFSVYGFPKRLHSDQGANFESTLIAELLHVAGVHKSHTTPYHPMGNGSCERMNRTLGNMIRALPPRAKHRWPQTLKSLTFAYNCTVHETTGYAPFLLMFGRVPRLPVDVMFGSVLNDPEVVDYDRYVESLRQNMREAMAVAQSTATKQLQRHTGLYNKKVRGAPVEVDDRVLLANKGERGKRKLADRWENTIYVVVEKNDDSHTFKIQNPTSGQIKVVHRNLIMPVNFLPLPETESNDQEEDVLSPVSSSVDLSRSAVTDASSESAEFRTRAWVSKLPSNTGSVTNVEDGVLEDAVPENVQLNEPESGSMDPSLTQAPVPCPDPETTM